MLISASQRSIQTAVLKNLSNYVYPYALTLVIRFLDNAYSVIQVNTKKYAVHR